MTTNEGLLILSRSDIARLMAYDDYVDAVAEAFVAAENGKAVAPPASALHLPDGTFHAKAAALIDGQAVAAIKLNGNFPGNPLAHRLPTVQGVIYLADAGNGRPLAVMDSIEVTINRTGAATTLAARHLARADARVGLVCGAGVQGRIQARALVAALPTLRTLHVWDVRPPAAVQLAEQLGRDLGLDVRVTDTLATARQSHAIATCTSATRPFLTTDLVKPGTFIAAVGADNPDKSEIDPKLYAASLAVVDSLEQAAEIGDLHHALAAGVVTRQHVHATLGEVLVGRKAGRTDGAAITLFDSTGLGLQDVAAAASIYRRARQAGTGLAVTLS